MGLGFLGRVKQFVRSVLNGEFYPDVQTDTGGKYNITSKLFQPAGDDCAPLPEDLAVTVETQKTGSLAAVGFIDPNNEGIALPGESRRYARDSGGVIQSQIFQRNDGTIIIENLLVSQTISPDGSVVIQNAGGFISLLSSGIVNINGTRFLQDGNIVMAGGADIDFGSTTYLTHTHLGNLGNPTSTPQ